MERRTEETSESIKPHHDAITLVDELLDLAAHRKASDVHIEPLADGSEVRLRIDGLLEPLTRHSTAVGRSMVTRLMVMAHLLTYKLDVPQEGRLRVQVPSSDNPLDLRLAIMPTTHGLRAAIRMPAELVQPRTLEGLALPPQVLEGLKTFASIDAGMLLITGPAGSGKTTTIYALLDYIARTNQGLSIVSLEDPVERDIPGVTQIEVSPFGQLTYDRALRSILRQDPQVLMLGEIRDAETASLASQAALSGHRLICTLHASTPGGAIARLIEMGLEPYRVTSSVYGIVAQRLVRKLAAPDPSKSDASNQPRYSGRVPVAELVTMTSSLRAAILAHADASQLQAIAAREPGYSSLRDSAHSLVAQHLTDISEILRVLGGEWIQP